MKKVVGQGIKHIIVGGFADLADIGFFNLIFLFFPAQIIVKAVSFLIAATIKYFGNKYWAFFTTPEPGGEGGLEKTSTKEIFVFLIITLVGLAINVAVFSFFVNIKGGLGFSAELWRQISVILALLITAIWNFCGYKFIVFKK